MKFIYEDQYFPPQKSSGIGFLYFNYFCLHFEFIKNKETRMTHSGRSGLNKFLNNKD